MKRKCQRSLVVLANAKAVLALFMAELIALVSTGCSSKADSKDIKLGLLFGLSGTMSAYDTTCYNGAKMAIDEINAAGGINGRKIVTVEEDYASDAAVATEKSKKMILEDKVVATVGGAFTFYAQPVYEENDGLLLFPVYYQGEIDYDNMVITGFVPNQQSFELLTYMNENVGKKAYLLGSDYEYPLVSFNQAKVLLNSLGGEVVGEEYVPLGHSDFSSVLNKIKSADPDYVVVGFAGDSAFAFQKQLAAIGWDFDDIKIASLTVDDMVTQSLPPESIAGTYVSFPYLTGIDLPENKKFIDDYVAKYGADSIKTLCVGTEETYILVKMFAEAMAKTKSDSAKDVMDAFRGLEINSPVGKVKMDAENLHTWYKPVLGKVNNEGVIEVIQTGSELVHPEPWSVLLYPDGPPSK
jgi:branched-chain amino acid transport system substrate-binding protein/urea transport system substrate-binding protein